jgi:NAD-dependent aldehyde dehydrogenases
MNFDIINPADGHRIASHVQQDDAEVRRAIEAAAEAQGAWRRRPFVERAALMRKVAALLRERTPELARQMAAEMGKPLKQGVAEAEKCASVCDYYAEHAQGFLAPQAVEDDAHKSFVAFEPLGVVLAIMPWNYPFWQVFRFAAPTLMAG